MRIVSIALAVAALTACDRADDPKASAPKPAALLFDGADYTDDAGKLAHGKRLATLLDCTGCHGDNLQGRNVSADDPGYGDMNAPNLTLISATYSDADFDRLLRHGTPKDGRELWFMPAESYQFLTDEDVAAVVAFVRSHKPEGQQLPPIRKGEGFLKEIASNGIGNAAQQTIRYRDQPPADMGPEHERGRMLARAVCAGCHNGKLQGYVGFTPDLDIAGTYSEAELETLLTTGKGKSKSDLGLMSLIARTGLSKMTPGERAAIIGYVKARAERPQAPQ